MSRKFKITRKHAVELLLATGCQNAPEYSDRRLIDRLHNYAELPQDRRDAVQGGLARLQSAMQLATARGDLIELVEQKGPSTEAVKAKAGLKIKTRSATKGEVNEIVRSGKKTPFESHYEAEAKKTTAFVADKKKKFHDDAEAQKSQPPRARPAPPKASGDVPPKEFGVPYTKGVHDAIQNVMKAAGKEGAGKNRTGPPITSKVGKPKKAMPARGVGIKEKVIDLLENASSRRPITKAAIRAGVIKAFGARRDPSTLERTVNYYVPGYLRRCGIDVRSSPQGYWIEEE